MNKFRKVLLGNPDVKFIDGDRSSKYPKRDELINEGILFLNAASINNGKINENVANYISQEKFDQIKKGRINKDDILLTTRGNGVGDVAFVNIDKKGIINAQMLILRVNQARFEPKFIYYYLSNKTMNTYIWNFASGSAQPQIPIRDLNKIPLFLPSLISQKKIAAILSAYDDLIENNNHRIALLEKMAEEIYREWFVRFRFSGYQDIKFEKGIPEGWKVSRVASLGNVITGKTPLTSNSKYYGNDFHFIKTPDMHNQTYIFDTEEKLTQLGLESQPSQIIPPDSICVSCIGTGGIVSITTEISSTNQQINSIILKEKSDLEWAFYTLKALRQTILAFGATGSTMTNLSKGKFSNLQIIIPPLALRKKYHFITLPLFEQIKKLSMLNHQLLSTKNLLLPRLLSGKLSVENLEIAFPPSMQQEEGKVD